MGVLLAGRDSFLEELGQVGWASILFCLVPVAFSTIAVYALTNLFMSDIARRPAGRQDVYKRQEKRQPAVVLGHKSACMIAGFLGCLKSGHAFVPVDTEMPLTRLADILSQLGETLVVVTEDMPDALARCV